MESKESAECGFSRGSTSTSTTKEQQQQLDFSLGDARLPASTTISRVKPKHESFFNVTPPFSLSNSTFYPVPYTSRQRSLPSEFRPPHDFSNPIWEYFALEEAGKATCKVCGKRITYRNNAYVTNLVTHLRTKGVGHDTCYNSYMLRKSETSSKFRDELALNYLLSNMASTVFGQEVPDTTKDFTEK